MAAVLKAFAFAIPNAPPEDPAATEYNALSSDLQKEFQLEGDGLAQYRLVTAEIKSTLNKSASAFIADKLRKVTFLGSPEDWAHVDLIAKLTAAASALGVSYMGVSYTGKVAQLDAFQPRYTKDKHGNPTTLSKHAYGRAVDLDELHNPQIDDEGDIAVILKVTGANFATSLDFAALKKANDDFKAMFNQAWVDSQTDTALIAKVRDRRKKLDLWAKQGFLNLDEVLVKALTDTGLKWGGGYANKKDFMHFELPGGPA